MRVHALGLGWLPEAEALPLRRAIAVELCRLYEAADEWPLPDTLRLAGLPVPSSQEDEDDDAPTTTHRRRRT